ncbi:hypothetical protein [Streptomyces sp. MBT62]|uniref:hypothetical protein n=1 Tax=Streptomyces sp. MBT62 TaxID=2800410 RepID=UPI00190C846C|nr:hypothetical protein [Streptomyces sp. MBT62]MBK3563615.1 hypothetical protein [Streptomyces sp. MBT62]
MLARLDAVERWRLLVATPEGRWVPAMAWLNHVRLRAAAPHVLRHSYPSITLELLWRGHLQGLGEMN